MFCFKKKPVPISKAFTSINKKVEKNNKANSSICYFLYILFFNISENQLTKAIYCLSL